MEDRFFSKVKKTNSCWEWQGAKRLGYGVFKVDGKTKGAHRQSWELHKGVIPKGLLVLHKCDNRGCVNPSHLFLGSHSDNMKDVQMKGRLKLPEGVKFTNGRIPVNRSLSCEEDIVRVKFLIKSRKSTLKKVSEDNGIPYQLLRDINCGRVYK